MSLLYIARKRTFKKDQLMICIHEKTPNIMKRPLPTFKKINFIVATIPLIIFPLNR